MKKKLLVDGKYLMIGGHDIGTTVTRYVKENHGIEVIVVGAGDDTELERGITIHDKGLRETPKHDPFGPETFYITSQGSYDYPFFSDAPKTKNRKQNNRKVKRRKKACNGPSGKKRKK